VVCYIGNQAFTWEGLKGEKSDVLHLMVSNMQQQRKIHSFLAAEMKLFIETRACFADSWR
jgi:hypothetical protein